jgi:hypothetical protein
MILFPIALRKYIRHMPKREEKRNSFRRKGTESMSKEKSFSEELEH